MPLRPDRTIIAISLALLFITSPALARDHSTGIYLDADQGLSFLEKSGDEWLDTRLRLRREKADRTSAASVRYARRFGQDEFLVELSHREKINSHVSIHTMSAIGIDSQFLPDWKIGAGTDILLSDNGPGADILHFEAKAMHYNDQTFLSLSPGATRYFAASNAFLRVDALLVAGGGGPSRLGATASGGIDLVERLSARAWLGIAPETENGFTQIIRTAAAGLVHQSGDQQFRITLAAEDREIGSDRLTVSLGFSHHF